jgi:23S rRNA pseudouridine1911/1915/1917 synthase
MEAGFVTVDGKAAKRNMTAYGDEKIVILPQAAPEDEAFKPEAMELNIVFEDEHLIVINKPAGLVVHPGPGNWSGTLLNGLLHHCPQLAGVPRAGIVHRLDKDTSGLMVVGKTLAQTDLVRQLQARTVKREYFALVWGTPRISGTIDASMGRHPRDRVKMAENFTAKPAITHYELIGSGELDRRPVSLVQCRLETGRTHQIRVHMQHRLCAGRRHVYGKQHLVSVFSRQALQARRLGWCIRTLEACEWIVPLADDFAELIATAGIPSRNRSDDGSLALYPALARPAGQCGRAVDRARGRRQPGPYGDGQGGGGLNLGTHVGDDAARVAANRAAGAVLPSEPAWLSQVHGVAVADAASLDGKVPDADASIATQPGAVCVMMTADCLPVLFCSTDGLVVGAAHAGWRGLANGVLQRTVDAMRAQGEILAWLGPAIGPQQFEVGQDVLQAFRDGARDAAERQVLSAAFTAIAGKPGKYLADIYALARTMLLRDGVAQVAGGEYCTVSDAAQFYSTGAMASREDRPA